MKQNLQLVKDYAFTHKISIQAVYKKIKKGSLKAVENKGKKHIILNQNIKPSLKPKIAKPLEDYQKDNEILQIKLDEKEKLLQAKDSIIEAKTKENEALKFASLAIKNQKEILVIETNQKLKNKFKIGLVIGLIFGLISTFIFFLF